MYRVKTTLDGRAIPADITVSQETLLVNNPLFVVASYLDDGDLLILDTTPTDSPVFIDGHFGPYVLTREGYVQNVHYHYRRNHGLAVPYQDNTLMITLDPDHNPRRYTCDDPNCNGHPKSWRQSPDGRLSGTFARENGSGA
jgi:hypothetical protein